MQIYKACFFAVFYAAILISNTGCSSDGFEANKDIAEDTSASSTPPTSTPTPSPTVTPTPTPQPTVMPTPMPTPSISPSPSPTPTPMPTMTPAPQPSAGFLHGVNIAGGSFNSGKDGAKLYQDYIYPNKKQIDYFAAKGMKIIRVDFDLHRLQPQRMGPLDLNELALLDAVFDYAISKGLKVLLDPHNYARLKDNDGVKRVLVKDPLMPAENLADFWEKMAVYYMDEPNIYFGLMNEPYGLTAEEWKVAAVASVNAIRSVGATNKILIPGTFWSGAHAWVKSGNAAAWEGFQDINFAFEVHQYLDHDSSGTNTECISGKGLAGLEVFTTWAKANNVQGLLGEFGWANNSTCMNDGGAMVKHMVDNQDVWLGYTYWAAGAWWGNYMYSIEPSGLGTSTVTDKPQMSVLEKYINQ